MKLISGQKDGSASAKDSLEKVDKLYRPRRDYTTTHFVLADPTETLNDIRNGFPNMGTIDQNAYLKGISPREIATVIDPETGNLAVLYEVDTEYDSSFAQDNEDDKVDQDNPPNTRPTRRWSSEKDDEVLEQDADTGEPIVTGCNESIILEHKVSIHVLEISRYEDPSTDIPARKREYENTRNENEIYGYAAGCGVIDEIVAEEEWIENSQNIRTLWLKVTYRVKFRFKPYTEEGWQVQVLHEGYLFKPKAGMKPRQFLDEETKEPRKVLLITDPDDEDNHGVILPENADPNYLKFNRFPKRDWSPLELEY